MAKVLSCPNCGHKHGLDLLVGLDFFLCKECGKKLAVPQEVTNLVESKKEERVLAIVASATLSEISKFDNSKIEIQSAEKTHSVNNSKEDTTNNKESEKQKPKHEHMHLPHGHIAQIGFSVFLKTVIWIMSIGAGFLCVVIIPRLFGFGFHAIDFVDVITQNGILKYKVVVYLVTLWSIATALFVGIFNYFVTKFKRSR